MLYWATKIRDIKGMDVGILTKHRPKANAEMTAEEKGLLGGGKRKAILCGQIRN
jgi:hypothetical protein